MAGKVRQNFLVTDSFAVCQLGARMHYAVPRLLHAAGLLEKFYTDLCAQKGWLRGLKMIPKALQPSAVRRLGARVVPEVPTRKIISFASFGINYVRRRNAARNARELAEIYLWAGRRFCELVLQDGISNIASVYTFNTAGLEVLRKARAQGIRTVMEQTIAPQLSELRLMRRQRELNPEWESYSSDEAAVESLVEREKSEWDNSDLILCGSDFVRDQIAACGGPRERCAVVPYGVDLNMISRKRDCRKGLLRILTIGAIGLRKGSPYVLEAAKRLKGRATFRILGAASIPSPVLQSFINAGVEIHGHVPRSEIGDHLNWADVFLLPSICEGSATATYEALAAGLPVIATPNTGSVVRDGREGFIVRCGETDPIVEKLEFLAGNPDLLAELSQNAKLRAAEFTLAAYGERLLAALKMPSQD